jgi:two-component system, OmpR family, alkaline phosphatase synthesis response regulator PhoP
MAELILLVDDEADILEFLKYNLIKAGYSVETANNGREGIAKAKELKPALILLDVMMPEVDGIEVCYVLRKEMKNEMPLIAFLTARTEDYSQVAGFEAGGDDYITKPIRPRLLISKIEALLRRKNRHFSSPAIDNEKIKIDRDRFMLTVNNQEILLPRKEFELLALLISKPGYVFTRDKIMSDVWGNETIVGERTIDVHIRKLREKIGDDYIRTIKGVGYTFNG